MKKCLLILSILASSTIGCEKAIDIDVPYEDPKLVLNGFLNPDSSIAVHVSKSQFVLDNAELKNIIDAKVWVYQGEELLGELQHQESGLYKLPGVKPEIGQTYTIRAEKAGLPPVKASERLPSFPTVGEVVLDSLGKGQYGELKLRVSFTLEDPAGQGNYYLVHVVEKGFRKHIQYNYPHEPDQEREFTWEPYFYEHRIESTDPLVEELCGGYISCGLLLKDVQFDGKSHPLTVIAEASSRYDPEYVKEVEVNLMVLQIPKSYYLYFKTLDINREASDNPFAEPAKVFSNVEGGFGLWSAIAPFTYKLNQ